MNLERFVAERRGSWDELEQLVGRARGRAERLGGPGVRRLANLYRGASADLALARRRFPTDPVVPRLERLVSGAWHLVYDVEPRRETVGSFFSTGYWRRLLERPALLAAAAALLLAPAVLGAVWAVSDAEAALRFVPEAFRGVTQRLPAGTGAPGAEEAAALSGVIFVNNIRVSFFAFAGGILAGFGTAWVLALNGLLLGTVGGLAFGAGNGRSFTELVTPHGVLELSCIVVTAAAGLRMGWALVDPGRRPRSRALLDEARRAVEIVLGTIPWFVLAGLVEGFVTPRRPGLPAALTIGFGAAIAFWGLALSRGRPYPLTPGRVPSP